MVVFGAWATPAAAAGPGASALAVSPAGHVLAGYPSGAIVRYDATTGDQLRRLEIPIGSRRGSVGGIVALDYGPAAAGKRRAGRFWVLDDNLRLQQFSARGKLKRSMRLFSCEEGIRPKPGVRGGLDVTSKSIYVAHPCRNSVARYDRRKLKQRASAGIAGPHGIAVQDNADVLRSGRRLFVAQPGAGQVARLSPRRLHSGEPLGLRGAAADVDVAADGRIFVSVTQDDPASGERIYIYDAAGAELANLGRPGTGLGDLDDPVAIALAPPTASSPTSSLFIADSGNGRLQRWGDDGFTLWGVLAIDPG